MLNFIDRKNIFSNEDEYTRETVKIRRIIIKKLHGDKDLKINIYNNCLIIVGDNGFGKTSILNIIYCILSGNTKYIKDINFHSVVVYYELGSSNITDVIEFEKIEFEIYNKFNDQDPILSKKTLSRKNIHSYARTFKELQMSMFDEDYKNSDIDSIEEYMKKNKREMSLENIFTEYKVISKKISRIKEILGFETLFLPTYRRIEQNLEYFGLGEIEDNNINFGMNDVKHAIKKITDDILQSSINWVSKVNGEIINEILSIDEKDISFDKKNEESIRKTLNRIDKRYLSNNSKKKIMSLIYSGDINNNKALVYFLNNMLKLYEEQNKNDNKLKRFSKVCNKYLKNKEIQYDEIEVNLKVIKKTSRQSEEINFDLLSSGEKQIISIFARLILTEEKNIAVIFDEPEISISIDWQKMILEDIYNLDNCNFLIASTHSPFVFANKLQEFTVDIEQNLG
ncbi:AAA family ATPase [uncultured Psychrobacter sp.]|uniref:AAA family ATPase n=1 Tax=uncultured Psychrobacter sp. TaxID=259303 RepID=UPI00345A62D4